MASIRYLVSMAGPEYVVKVGDVREVEADEAARLIDAGFASVVEDTPKVEHATKSRKK